jgi:broad specificity phosphatase PhoE
MMAGMKPRLWLCLLLLAAAPVFAKDSPGLADTVVLVIRHAEKPPSGDSLTPAGEARAKAYVHYFQNYTIDAKPETVDYLFAAADSKGSKRPRLTLTPLSQATGLAVDQRFTDKQFQKLADELQAKRHGKLIVICWHHGEIPGLLRALGAMPEEVLPKGKWPDEVFGWVIQLRYDEKGQLIETRHIKENLMPDDAGMQDDPVNVSSVHSEP